MLIPFSEIGFSFFCWVMILNAHDTASKLLLLKEIFWIQP